MITLDQSTKKVCESIVAFLQQPLAIVTKGEEIISIIVCETIDLYNPGSHQYQDDLVGVDITQKIELKEFTSVGSPTGTSDLRTYFDKTSKIKYSIRGFDVIVMTNEFD